ncbi:hypothetical protein AHAS_Ahas13G0392800 [Arachis hypogaea]
MLHSFSFGVQTSRQFQPRIQAISTMSNVAVTAHMKTKAITEHWLGEKNERSDKSGKPCGHGNDRFEVAVLDCLNYARYNENWGRIMSFLNRGSQGSFCPLLELPETILSSVRIDGAKDLNIDNLEVPIVNENVVWLQRSIVGGTKMAIDFNELPQKIHRDWPCTSGFDVLVREVGGEVYREESFWKRKNETGDRDMINGEEMQDAGTGSLLNYSDERRVVDWDMVAVPAEEHMNDEQDEGRMDIDSEDTISNNYEDCYGNQTYENTRKDNRLVPNRPNKLIMGHEAWLKERACWKGAAIGPSNRVRPNPVSTTTRQEMRPLLQDATQTALPRRSWADTGLLRREDGCGRPESEASKPAALLTWQGTQPLTMDVTHMEPGYMSHGQQRHMEEGRGQQRHLEEDIGEAVAEGLDRGTSTAMKATKDDRDRRQGTHIIDISAELIPTQKVFCKLEEARMMSDVAAAGNCNDDGIGNGHGQKDANVHGTDSGLEMEASSDSGSKSHSEEQRPSLEEKMAENKEA